jgi:hypothetical protein
MKKILITMLITFAFVTKASALDLIVPASAGGTYHKFASMIADDLKANGHEVNLVVSGNCVIGKKQWNDSESAIMINSEATNAVPKCNVPITKNNFAHNIFTAGWVIISKTESLGERMGIVSYMKNTVKDLDVKLVPYKNTTEIKAAFLAGEIDSAFLTTGTASEIENKFELVNTQTRDKGKFKTWKNNDLTLNYYLMSKNVDVEIIDLIKSNEKLKAIASKKNMSPVMYENLNKQVNYLKRNENKWK